MVNVPDGVVAQYARELGRLPLRLEGGGRPNGLVALGQSASAGQMEGIDAGRPRRESDLEVCRLPVWVWRIGVCAACVCVVGACVVCQRDDRRVV